MPESTQATKTTPSINEKLNELDLPNPEPKLGLFLCGGSFDDEPGLWDLFFLEPNRIPNKSIKSGGFPDEPSFLSDLFVLSLSSLQGMLYS